MEVKFHHSWGTICDDHWTLREANVVCRSMGFGTAAGATRAAYFGKGVGKVNIINKPFLITDSATLSTSKSSNLVLHGLNTYCLVNFPV